MAVAMTSKIVKKYGDIKNVPPMSPDGIATNFCTQYYYVRRNFPTEIFRFYRNDSYIVIPGHLDTIVGKENIKNALASSWLSGTNTRIHGIDGIMSIDDICVIVASGECIKEDDSRGFSETFILQRYNDNVYYIKNQVFHYQGRVEEGFLAENSLCKDTSTVSENNTAVNISPKVSTESCENGDSGLPIVPDRECIESENNVENDMPSKQYVNGTYKNGVDSGVNSEKATNGVDHSPLEESDKVSSHTTEPRKDSATVELDEVPATETSPNKTQNDSNPIETTDTVVSPPTKTVEATEKVKTWAQVTVKCKNLDKDFVGIKPSSRKVANGNQQQTETNAVVAPSTTNGANALKSNNGNRQSNRTNNTKNSNFEKDSSRVVSGNFAGGAVSGAVSSVGDTFDQYDNDQQLFMGNLPRWLQRDELMDFFSNYGKVLDLRINSGQGRIVSAGRSVPNYGFVVFESSEVAQSVLAKKPLFIKNNQRINVEAKRSSITSYNNGNSRNRRTMG